MRLLLAVVVPVMFGVWVVNGLRQGPWWIDSLATATAAVIVCTAMVRRRR